MSLVKLILNHFQALKLLQKIKYQQLTDSWVTPKFFKSNLQVFLHIMPRWSLKIIMNFFLQETWYIAFYLGTYTDNLSSHFAIHPHRDPSRKLTKSFILLMIQLNHVLWFHTLLASFTRNKRVKEFSAQSSLKLPRKNKQIPKTTPFKHFHQGTYGHWSNINNTLENF